MTTYQIINTWNGGKGGRTVEFTGTQNACFEWILKNTPFSYHEATTRQGYSVEKVEGLAKPGTRPECGFPRKVS